MAPPPPSTYFSNGDGKRCNKEHENPNNNNKRKRVPPKSATSRKSMTSTAKNATSKRKRTNSNGSTNSKKMAYYGDDSESSVNSSPEEDYHLCYGKSRQGSRRKYYNETADRLSNFLRDAVSTIIPEVRKCIEREYTEKPFVEFPTWYSLYQDALEESWELIIRREQRPEKFQADGGHITVFLLAAEVDPKHFGPIKNYIPARNQKRLRYIKELDHRIKSLPCSSGTKRTPSPQSSTSKTASTSATNT